MTYEERRRLRLKETAKQIASISVQDALMIQDNLAQMAHEHPANTAADLDFYYFKALQIQKYRGFRITLCGFGYPRLITVKNFN